MKNPICIFFGLIGLFLSMPAWAGHATGNGGNIVYCAGPEFSSQGYQVLDYAMALESGSSPSDFRIPAGWAESATNIEALLETLDANAAASFQSFADGISTGNHALIDFSSPAREWLPYLEKAYIPLGFQYANQVPTGCLQDPHFPNLSGIQTFRIVTRIQSQNESITTYFYDPSAVLELQGFSSLQYSFLMVHEWLWDYTSDPAINREMNIALHQKTLSAQQKAILQTFLSQRSHSKGSSTPGNTFLGGRWQECGLSHQAANESLPTCDKWDGNLSSFSISSASLAAIHEHLIWLSYIDDQMIGPCLVETMGRAGPIETHTVAWGGFQGMEYSANFQWDGIFLVPSPVNHPRCLEFADKINAVPSTLWDGIDVIQDQRTGEAFLHEIDLLTPIRQIPSTD